VTDLRVYPGVATVQRATADGGWLPARATRDGSICSIDWRQLAVMEGKGYIMQMGDEDAPINSTVAITDILVWATVDVPLGTTIIPISAQAAIGVWAATSVLIDFMIEVDDAKVRRGSGGAAFVPLNLNTGSSNTSACTCYTLTGAGVVATAKVAGHSLELFRASVEVNWGDAGDDFPNLFWTPKVPPTIVGPASLVLHLGATTADCQAYGNVQWIELPSTAIT